MSYTAGTEGTSSRSVVGPALWRARWVVFGAALVALSAQAFAQTKWDLPAGYPASNFHTENLEQFAKDVDKATGGKLKITVHPNAALFKAPEIKRAVREEGMRFLRESAVSRVLSGETTLREINKVTFVD